MADATPPPWMQPGAPPTHAAKEDVPPPQPMEQDDDEDLYGNETQEQADAKFMAALDANEARKAAKQAALDLQAKEGDAEWEKQKPPPPPNGGYEEPTEEVLKMRAAMEKVFMATLTDPHYQEHPVPMVRSQASHDKCKELLDLCKLPEEELPQPHIIKRKIEQARVDPDAWVRATAGSAAKAFGIKEVADDFDEELRRKFGHLLSDEDKAGPRRWDPVGLFDDRWKSELVLPPLPEFEKHCNFRTDEEVRELMQQRSAPRQAPRSAPVARGRGGVQGRLGRGRGTQQKPRFKPTQKRRAVVMLDDAPEIKPVGKDGRVKEPPKPKPEKPSKPDADDVTLDDLSNKAITDVFGENLNLLDDAGRKLLGVFLRKAPKPPGAGDKVKVHQETDSEAIRTDYLKLNWDDYTYTRTRKRKAVQAPT